ncbi:MAG: hypothetical protein CLLPBCKN_001367 [Chroococcidiopsis cubana SAG 39.79]|uniref:PhoU domain-containing protein n=1 Tax=Chroococcidiopsis cubana SAG 39.79 TaxID=388085 RepID=A0AB37U8E1_9CYAN|nr:hypothetical protein [Chroococcidiopsis cubana]MDZ4871979.1 hypothetical protein [Chroococcidiopsis cubana SAG 39.79]PSB56144.1 hypothetical protein C7B79_32560 [Chroococcidiopsis cubana CCALA 043]RUS94411.1 hypothetical protein DSM107010_71990 [Chroococcidiopsis cubana SAG 39.79]
MPEVTVFTCLEQQVLKLQEQGIKIEQLGKRIQEHSDQLALEHGQLIEECGQVIQQKAEEVDIYLEIVVELTEEAQTNTEVAINLDEYHTELITFISRLQLEARIAFVQALVIFSQMMQRRIELVGKHL